MVLHIELVIGYSLNGGVWGNKRETTIGRGCTIGVWQSSVVKEIERQ